VWHLSQSSALIVQELLAAAVIHINLSNVIVNPGKKEKYAANNMNLVINESCIKSASEKKAYEPPRAMRQGEMGNGTGSCFGSGSGDEYCQNNGNSALGCESGNIQG
jgi:hypothetical protein